MAVSSLSSSSNLWQQLLRPWQKHLQPSRLHHMLLPVSPTSELVSSSDLPLFSIYSTWFLYCAVIVFPFCLATGSPLVRTKGECPVSRLAFILGFLCLALLFSVLSLQRVFYTVFVFAARHCIGTERVLVYCLTAVKRGAMVFILMSVFAVRTTSKWERGCF